MARRDLVRAEGAGQMLENVVAGGLASTGEAAALMALHAPVVPACAGAIEVQPEEPDAAHALELDDINLAIGDALAASARATALHHQAASHIESVACEIAAIRRLLTAGSE